MGCLCGDMRGVLSYGGGVMKRFWNLFKTELIPPPLPPPAKPPIILLTDIYPKYYGYAEHKGYTNCTACDDCCRIGAYEDQHPANPCRRCGGPISEGFIAKYDFDQKEWMVKS